ncbi:MAG: phosphotransferase [Flexilinea sp.]
MNDCIDPTQINKICEILDIPNEDIKSIVKNNKGLNNDTFVVTTAEKTYFYRIPGFGTNLFCDRKREYDSYQLIAPYKMTDSLVYFEPETGVKMSIYYPGSHTVSVCNDEELRVAMKLIRRFHELPVRLDAADTHFQRLERYTGYALNFGGRFDPMFYQYLDSIEKIKRRIAQLPVQIEPTHGDFIPDNVLIRENAAPLIIDMEFTAMSDPFEDIGTFCHHGDLNPDQAEKILKFYLQADPTNEERFRTYAYCAVGAMMWYAWAVYKLAVGGERKTYQDFADRSLRYFETNFPIALEVAA